MTDAAKEMMHQKKPPPPPKSNSKYALPPNPLHSSLPALSKAYSNIKERVNNREKNDL